MLPLLVARAGTVQMSASFTPTTTLCTRFSKNQPNTGSKIDVWLLVVVLEVNTTSLLMKNVDPKELVTVKIHLSMLIGWLLFNRSRAPENGSWFTQLSLCNTCF
ncbi:hypothetical protein YC2023_083301 [Brassica napus]